MWSLCNRGIDMKKERRKKKEERSKKFLLIKQPMLWYIKLMNLCLLGDEECEKYVYGF